MARSTIPNTQSSTPRPLKILVFSTLILGVLFALLDKILPHFSGWVAPSQFLGLSWTGIEKGYFWQAISYLFIIPPESGLAFSEIISMGFNAYLLWVLGTMVYERKGPAHFFSVYFGSALASAALILFFQHLTPGHFPFGGNTGALYAVLMAWLMLHPNAEMLFFLMIPLKAKWLVIGLLGLSLFVDLSVGAYLHAMANLVGAIFGYFYSVFIWGAKGPFRILLGFENFVDRMLTPLRGGSERSFVPKAKIYDFKTGKAILKDDEFLDAMLTKISLYGRSSLTWRERWRLRRISKKKAQD